MSGATQINRGFQERASSQEQGFRATRLSAVRVDHAAMEPQKPSWSEALVERRQRDRKRLSRADGARLEVQDVGVECHLAKLQTAFYLFWHFLYTPRYSNRNTDMFQYSTPKTKGIEAHLGFKFFYIGNCSCQ